MAMEPREAEVRSAPVAAWVSLASLLLTLLVSAGLAAWFPWHGGWQVQQPAVGPACGILALVILLSIFGVTFGIGAMVTYRNVTPRVPRTWLLLVLLVTSAMLIVLGALGQAFLYFGSFMFIGG
jgi:hypothetical protein